MSFITDSIVEHCEKYPDVKELSRLPALELLYKVRNDLAVLGWEFARERGYELLEFVQEIDEDLCRVDRLIQWLEEE